MQYYCTLFDKKYLLRGLALYNSLKKNSKSFFKLFVFPVDDECKEILSQYTSENLVLVDKIDFEDEKLLKVKQERGRAEYCWTCTPSLILYCINKFDLPHCTYLDADIFFFNSPELLTDEMSENDSILITKHNYSPQHEQSEESGIYCVQFVLFKNTNNGMSALEWWREACLGSCELDPEKGKCGDQKYLDDWTTRFDGVYVLKNLGGGVAPWNIQQHKIRKEDNQVFVINELEKTPVVFFHFHGLKFFDEKLVQFSGSRYEISQNDKVLIYSRYINELIKVRQEVEENGVVLLLNDESLEQSALSLINQLKRIIKLKIFRNFNVLWPLSEFSTQLKCPVCASNNTQIYFHELFDDRYGYPGKFVLYHCSECNHKFLEKNFNDSELVKLYSNFYPRSNLKLENFQALKSEQGFKAWLNGAKSGAYLWVPQNVKVLDIGCGFGESLAYHQGRGCEAYGIEADRNIKRFGAKFKLNVQVGLFSPDYFKGIQFDYVTLDQVIEHSAQPHKFLADVKKVLKDDGVVILSTPNSISWGSRVFGCKWINWHIPYHVNLFSKESLSQLADQSGFTILTKKTITHSNWLLYQWLHLICFPEMGKKSIFWTGEKKGLVYLFSWAFFHALHWVGFNHLLTRLLDCIGKGDNLIIVMKKNA